MGMIFDDISVEETEDYSTYEALSNINEDVFSPSYNNSFLQELNLDINNVSRGMLLSYGAAKGIVPVGTFLLVGFINHDGTVTNEDYVKAHGGLTVFKQVYIDDDDNIQIKDNSNNIIMPYTTYQIACQNIPHNNSELMQLSGSETAGPELVEMVSDTIKDVLSEKQDMDGNKEIYLRGSTLLSAHASYIDSKGNDLGLNYTFYPFKLSPILVLKDNNEEKVLKR